MDKKELPAMVALAKKGDEHAIRRLYTETKAYAYYVARQYLQTDADAQDALQETYGTVFAKLDSLTDGRAFMAWLHKIVTNKCLNIIKRSRIAYVSMDEVAEFAADTEEVLPAEWVDRAEKRTEIMRIIHELPPGHRLAVLLHYIEGRPIAEVAEEMGITVEAVRNHLYHGRKAIKALVLEEEKKGNKLYALVPLPILAKVFELEAAHAAIPETVSQAVWQGISEGGSVPGPPANTAYASPARARKTRQGGGIMNRFMALNAGKKMLILVATALAAALLIVGILALCGAFAPGGETADNPPILETAPSPSPALSETATGDTAATPPQVQGAPPICVWVLEGIVEGVVDIGATQGYPGMLESFFYEFSFYMPDAAYPAGSYGGGIYAAAKVDASGMLADMMQNIPAGMAEAHFDAEGYALHTDISLPVYNYRDFQAGLVDWPDAYDATGNLILPLPDEYVSRSIIVMNFIAASTAGGSGNTGGGSFQIGDISSLAEGPAEAELRFIIEADAVWGDDFYHDDTGIRKVRIYISCGGVWLSGEGSLRRLPDIFDFTADITDLIAKYGMEPTN
ncbi:MAG: RNA polymerase sigma factor [Clostridiales bacterium]|nr:RNA polymerase sigma factor [Clostridiales bacterium]